MDVKYCCLFQTLNAPCCPCEFAVIPCDTSIFSLGGAGATDLETTLEKPVGPLTTLFFF